MDTSEREICRRCGEPINKHGIDQMTLEPTKCPVPVGPENDYLVENIDPERRV